MKHPMFVSITAAAAMGLFPATHALAQTTGISNPEAVEDGTATGVSGAIHAEKAVAAPASCPAPAPDPTLHVHGAEADPLSTPVVYGAFKAYTAPAPPAAPQPGSPQPGSPQPVPVSLGSSSAAASSYALSPSTAAGSSPAVSRESSAVVYGAYKPYRPGGEAPVADLPPVTITEGTELQASLQQPLSTHSTHEGDHFTAALQSDYSYGGSLLLPAGSLVHGRITRIHGGHLIGGNSAIHLQPDTVSLPDGTVYRISAEVSGLDHARISHVNREGTIVGNLDAKGTAAMLGFTTGSTVVVGAMVGGGVGAIVGLGVGAGIATVWWLKQDRQLAIPAGTQIDFTLARSLKVRPAAR